MADTHINFVFRLMGKHKSFSFINFTGLITGITVCLFIAQFVWFERSFENFNKNANRTYRVNLYNTHNGVFDNISAETVSGLAYEIKENIPAVESIGRVSYNNIGVTVNTERQIRDIENEIVFADPSIIEILGLELMNGSDVQGLEKPQSAAITESVALKYFGHNNVIGEILEIGFSGNTIETKPYQIQCVFKDIPANSNRHFNIILPTENEQAWNENWAWSNVQTFLVLPPHTKQANLTDGFNKIVTKHHQDGKGDKYLLEPITDIRLYALDGSGRSTLINFFIILGIIILLLAWFNYMNLSTARFFERMREVGVRKMMGASRWNLINQFLTETFVLNVLSFSIALILFIISRPLITIAFQINIPASLLNEPQAFFIMFGFIVTSTLVSGFYPSLYLSSFNPLLTVKGKLSNFYDHSKLRKVLVVIQLSMSFILISAIFAIEHQLDFMQNHNLGIDIEQTIIIDPPILTDASSIEKFEVFKNEILKMPTINGVTYATSFPGAEINWHRTDIKLGDVNNEYRFDSRIISMGTDFFNVFDLPIITGRNINSENESDAKSMLINEEACKMFGFSNTTDALNKLVFVGSRRFEVIGVVKNYHFQSLQYRIQPVLFIQGSPRNPGYAIKFNHENYQETLSAIETNWKEAYAGNVFKYHFLDDKFETQYAAEKQTGTLVSALTLIAIFISCLGLFGLSIYNVSRRTKEIGIRKVLGASETSVVFLLSKDFIKLIIIGILIGIPIIYKGVYLWLEHYSYKMDINASLFILPIIIITLLSMITIGFQTLKASKVNPVISIRNE